MSIDAGLTSASAPTSFVYVNGDRLSLMEDYRLPLYQYFPEGTKLFDPTHVPPREVPLSTSVDETGVTLPKLLPNAQYHAFFKDPRTGSLYATATKYVCLYVSRLPFNTTPEMLGRYFEAFDMVKEADVFPGQNVHCNGRGWVILQDPSKLLIIPRVLQFYGKQLIYTELSDREPARENLYHLFSEPVLPPPPPPPPRAHTIPHRIDAPSPPPPPMPPQHNPNVPAPRSSVMMERRPQPAALTPIGGGIEYDSPVLPAPRSQQRLQASTAPSAATTLAPTGSSSSSLAATAAAAAAPLHGNGAAKAQLPATFITYITEKDAEDAVRDEYFWPHSLFADEVQACLDARGATIVVFLFSSPPTVFGYARVLPKGVLGRREAKACPIEWIQHHCAIPETSIRLMDGILLFKQRDGSQLKPEAGAQLCDLIQSYTGKAEQHFSPLPTGPSIPLPRGRGGVVRGGRSVARPLPPPPIGRGRGAGGVVTLSGFISESGLAIPVPASRRNQANNSSSTANGATSQPGGNGSSNSRELSPTLLSVKLPAPASTRAAAVATAAGAATSNRNCIGGSSNGNGSLHDSTSSPTVPPAPRSKKSCAC
ncbi:hypothetical protein, conserved [Leishmania shawi]|uniref:RRM domain-containing protein n=1 Tax=Leishmania shawi TaxID=5680 RepID=A0ABR3E4U5_9TRYP